jgi:DNA polymerase V
MIGLVDCNNFYVSCERVFDPSLNGKPVIVLSNNDGCAISRSNEAKELGVKMGTPAFMIEDLIRKHDIKVFSSNYTLYGDMSRRVMTTLSRFVQEIEIYSIDEAFLYFNGYEYFDLVEYGRKMIRLIKQNTGIPVSLGIAPTKVLAKMANRLSKKKGNNGVFVIRAEEIDNVLSDYPTGDIWGIGRQHEKMLAKHNIKTAKDLVSMPRAWIRQHLTVVGERIYEELKGNHAIEPEFDIPARKNICTSRSFGEMQTEYAPIEEAMTMYVTRCAEKLRKQKSCANVMMVFLHTNQFREDLPQYTRNIVITLPVATNSTLELLHYARAGLKKIFRKGYSYKKVGIIVSEFVPENNVQQNFFDNTGRSRHSAIMKVMDELNSMMGRDTVRIATHGYENKWRLRQELLSKRYTTRLDEIINVRTDK